MCCTDELLNPSAPTPPVTTTSLTSTLCHVPDFGPNPSGAQMYIYVPTKLASPPPIIVAIHYCTGTAQAYFTHNRWASEADKHGFIVIYPESPHEGTCWDVSSPATLTHNGGSDSLAIANMITYAKQQYQAGDVFVTGTSSGGMMSQVMAATYPNLIKAGAPYCGLPAGGFAGTGIAQWNEACATGKVKRTSQEWAAIVKAAYPDYTGPRPRMQIWHGDSDEIIHFNNFWEGIKQWTGVLGVSESPTGTFADQPQGYTKLEYGGQVEGIYGKGVIHDIPVNETEVLRFFGLKKPFPCIE